MSVKRTVQLNALKHGDAAGAAVLTKHCLNYAYAFKRCDETVFWLTQKISQNTHDKLE